MSKNVSIKEGDRARNFGPTAKIKTDLQAGGSCYWVPEDERETGHIFASENREYTPDEIDKYGIDSIDVNIIFTGTTIDGDPWSVTIDPDTGLPIIDIDDVEITIDDITGDIDIHIPDTDITIDDADLDDFGIDPDADIDISIDDLGNIEISDGDISIDFDPETGEWDTGDCPASIRVMHVPNTTDYSDGLAVDYDGLVVQAFDKDGNPWSSKKYPDGYIPVHELSLPKYAEFDYSNEEIDSTTDEGTVTGKEGSGSVVSFGYTVVRRGKEYDYVDSIPGDYGIYYNTRNNNVTVCGVSTKRLTQGQSAYTHNGRTAYYHSRTSGLGFDVDYITPFNPNVPSLLDLWILAYGDKSIHPQTQELTVSWTGPCFTGLQASFDIQVSPKVDHGGSHHSGKF